MENVGSIVDLRKLLATQFPGVRLAIGQPPKSEGIPTGVAGLDMLLGGGLPRGAFTELVAGGNGSGSVEVIHALLHRVATNRQFLALVDGQGSFDPGATEPEVLARLLWIRCRTASQALKATDLLLRDRNFPVLVLDLKLNPPRDLRKIHDSTWYRYARLLEQNQTALLVVTPQKLVSGATWRVSIEGSLGIDALDRSRQELLCSLRFRLLKAPNQMDADWAAQAG